MALVKCSGQNKMLEEIWELPKTYLAAQTKSRVRNI